ncbi:hypothetical protein SAMN05444360_1463 [Chryseobacterium carnipullorum]|uniref:hypothetical protein n=1 Tax=Chryseobacterium carnipullorum TaxID=1124835 RepID=UPI000922C06A|nr:hypothetical protein [Chryseobacterium carnipullorum]SHN08576.1 hypothetical protein SAMN05444360_1463 [Chryseobacterium carnipullorum]
MRKYLILFCSLALFVGCKDKNNEEDKKNRLYLKEIKVNDKKIEWFYYSTIGSTTADYVLISDSINNKNDTIVNSTNLKDISFSNNNIVLSFYGKPRIYEDSITLKSNISGFNIKVDTTAISSGPTVRKFYQKK